MYFKLLCFLFCSIINEHFCFYSTSMNDMVTSSKLQNQYKSRIVPIEFYPYQVTVLNSDGFFCAGNIIGTKWILTAAHCRAARMKVYVGSHYCLQGAVYHVNVNVSSIHPLYKREYNNPHYDIMLLELWLKLQFGATVQPVKLSNSTRDFDEGTIGTLTGWGKMLPDESIDFEYLIRKLELPIITYEECESVVIQTRPEIGYTTPASDDKDLLCTKYDGPEIDKCIISAGAGLVTKVKGERLLVGISVHSVGCDSYRKRDVFVSIFFARKWIYNMIQAADW